MVSERRFKLTETPEVLPGSLLDYGDIFRDYLCKNFIQTYLNLFVKAVRYIHVYQCECLKTSVGALK